MTVRITVTDGTAPGAQIGDQIRGCIAIGALGANDRLPPVRQLASDLYVAPGTVAKVYRALESEGLLVTRIGAGTRVNPESASATAEVVAAARALVAHSAASGLSLDKATSILGADPTGRTW